MKRNSILCIIAVLLFSGCQFDFPLSQQHIIPIDSQLLGIWEAIPDEGDKTEQAEQMMVLKYSDTEYMIDYPIGSDGIYFRGYPINIGNVACMQLEVIGDAKGPPKKSTKDLFLVASYTITNNELEVKFLNTALVGSDLASRDELKKAFLENKDNDDLFVDPGLFKKIK